MLSRPPVLRGRLWPRSRPAPAATGGRVARAAVYMPVSFDAWMGLVHGHARCELCYSERHAQSKSRHLASSMRVIQKTCEFGDDEFRNFDDEM